MSSVQHLQHKREELQQQYDVLSQKIKRLRNNSVIEAGASVAFQLEQEIKLQNCKWSQIKISV
jgi:hypothetical protein